MKWNKDYDFLAIHTHHHEMFVIKLKFIYERGLNKKHAHSLYDVALFNSSFLRSTSSGRVIENLFFDEADGILETHQIEELETLGYTHCMPQQFVAHPRYPAVLKQ